MLEFECIFYHLCFYTQESIKAGRKMLGVIQKDATDKENLIGRQRALLNQKLLVNG